MVNALTYDARVLNKMLSQKGEDSRFNYVTLGDFIRNVDGAVYISQATISPSPDQHLCLS